MVTALPARYREDGKAVKRGTSQNTCPCSNTIRTAFGKKSERVYNDLLVVFFRCLCSVAFRMLLVNG